MTKGFISTLLLVIIALAVLKYFFDFSILDAISSEKGRDTIAYIRDIFKTLYSLLLNIFQK